MEKNSGSYIPGLHGLRAIAATAVIAYHIAPYGIKGGYLGVCLFFVLSGFLLASRGTMALAKRRFSVIEFYKSRIRRIYPSLVIFLLGICGILYFVEPELLKGTDGELLSILFGYNNWWQIAHEGSYFSQISSSSPFRHIWSLAMELQFYLLYPVFFLIFLSLLKFLKKRIALITYAILAILTAVPMAVAVLSGVDISRIYYGSDLRIYAILFGMFSGFLSVGIGKQNALDHKIFMTAVTYILLVGVIICFVFLDGQIEMTYIFGMQFVCAAMALLTFLVADGRISISRYLDIKPLKYIGSRTYEIYLWHYPFIVILQYKGYGNNPLAVVLVLLLTLILAEWTVQTAKVANRFVRRIIDKDEDKEIFSNDKSLPKRVIYIAATLSMTIVAALGIFGVATLSGQERFNFTELEQELSKNEKLLADIDDGESVQAAESIEATESSISEESDAGIETPTTEDEQVIADDGIDHTLVTIVGDSVVLGAAPKLLEIFPNIVVDAEKSRQLRGSMEIFEQLEAEGRLGGIVIIELGTNGPFREDEGQDIIDFLGENRQIYWVNVNGEHLEWTQRVNDLIAVLAAKNVNVERVNWASEAKEHPDWFYDDGIHLQKEGQEGYALFLYDRIF